MSETDIHSLLYHDEDLVTQRTCVLIEATGVAGSRGMWQQKLRWTGDCCWGSMQKMIVEEENFKMASNETPFH